MYINEDSYKKNEAKAIGYSKHEKKMLFKFKNQGWTWIIVKSTKYHINDVIRKDNKCYKGCIINIFIFTFFLHIFFPIISPMHLKERKDGLTSHN